MFKTSKNIFIEETEVKPNRFALYAMVFCVIGIVFCWLLNEIGIFRVGKWWMRIGSVVPLIAVGIPLFILIFNKKAFAHPGTKYLVISMASVMTICVTTMMTFHTTIMILFPLFAAMLYRSNRLGRIAFACALLCGVLSPILGYMLGVWDVEYFKELINIATGETVELTPWVQKIEWNAIQRILLYLSIPRIILVGSCAILMFYVIKIGVDHVDNQILLNQINQRDALTGLFNRNCYAEFLTDHPKEGKCGVIFFDVNELKPVNDLLGHEGGDLLLRSCGSCLREVFQEEHTGLFRIGGDEFVAICEGADEAQIQALMTRLDEAMAETNKSAELVKEGIACSMASGYALGTFDDLEHLIRLADAKMYINKKEYKEKKAKTEQ